MNRVFIVSLALMLMGGSALAQDDVGGGQAELIKQRAMHLRDVNNQQQGISRSSPNTPPGPGSYYQPTPNPPAPQPGINPAQQGLIDRVETDLNVIKAGVPATPFVKNALQNGIASLAKGATKPSTPAIKKLAEDLAETLADKGITPRDFAQLGKLINAVMNCAPFTQARSQTFVIAAQNILKSVGAGDASIKLIGADLTAIIIEIQKAKPRLYQ